MPIDFEAAERETAIAQGCERLWLFLNNLYEARQRWLGGITNDLCEFEPRIVPASGEPEELFSEWAKRVYRFVRTMRRIQLDRELCRAICLANDIGTPALTKVAWAFAAAMRGVSPAEIGAMLRRQQDVGRIRDAMSFVCFSAMRPKLLLGPTTAPTLEAIRGRCEQFAGRLKNSPESGAKEFLYDAPDISAGIWAAMRQLDAKVPPQPKWAIPIGDASQQQLDGLLDGEPWWSLHDVQAALAEALAWCEGRMPKANAARSAAQVVDASALAHEAQAAEQVTDAPRPFEAQTPELRPFSGGTMVFYQDRVELCGVVICSGPRSGNRRRALELFQKKDGSGSFVGYSGEELAKQLGLGAGQNAAASLVRDLRNEIEKTLRERANIACTPKDVIFSGGIGYRLSEKLSVQDGTAARAAGDQGHEQGSRRPDVPSRVPNRTNHVPNGPNQDSDEDVPDGDVPNEDVPDEDVPDDGATRQTWILEQLEAGAHIQAPHVAKQFGCSVKTAKRDFKRLKDKGRIEFFGSPRTGHFRLVSKRNLSGD